LGHAANHSAETIRVKHTLSVDPAIRLWNKEPPEENKPMTDMTIPTNLIPELALRQGAGGDYASGLCVMEAVAWMASEGATDHPECACPVLTAFAIRLNDSLSDENRQKLKPLILPLTGTRSNAHEQARAEYLVIAVSNRILAPVFEVRWPECAAALRNAKTMKQLHAAAADAAKAAAAAAADYAAVDAAVDDADAADAAAAADYAADAADAAYATAAAAAADYAADAAKAVDAAAYAAAKAVDAAYAAAKAANAGYVAARQRVLLECIPILREAIMLGPNGSDLWADYASRPEALSEFLRENV